MINLNELKVFNLKNMPEGIEAYKILNYEQIQIKSDEIKDIPENKDSIWTANDEFIKIIWRMIATCFEHKETSLSAPQIGIFKQFFVMRLFDLSGEGIRPLEQSIEKSPFIVLINPSWTLNNKNQARVSAYESCFYSPSEKIFIERPYSIISQYTTLNKKKENYNIIEEMNGWRARVFLHEYDHLLGKTLIDYKK